MDNIINYINHKFMNYEIIRNDEIEKLGNILINLLGLKKYVTRVEVKDIMFYSGKSRTLAYYDQNAKKIYIDYLNAYYLLTYDFELDDFSDPQKVIFINLKLLKLLLHEVLHVVRIKKENKKQRDFFSQVYQIAMIRKKELIDSGIYESFYIFNPYEREANVKALISLKKLLILFKNDQRYFFGNDPKLDVHLRFLEKELYETITYGYDENNLLVQNPFNKFMQGSNITTKKGDFYYFDLINNSIENEKNIRKRIVLGLPVKRIL